jgi:hypothetical protein
MRAEVLVRQRCSYCSDGECGFCDHGYIKRWWPVVESTVVEQNHANGLLRHKVVLVLEEPPAAPPLVQLAEVLADHDTDA